MTEEGAAPVREERALGSKVQSLSRALRLLNLLADEPNGIALSALARLAKLPTSTTHRLLSTMQEEGFVRFNNELLTWSVGVQAFVVGNAFMRSRNVAQIAHRFLIGLREQSGETANLAILNGDHAVFLLQAESREMMRALASPGAGVPLFCSGVGKALLSAQEAHERRAHVADGPLVQHTAKSITEPEALLRNLQEGRARGYSIDDEEHALGLRCVASSIFDENSQPIAAISLSGPTVRITDRRIDVLGQVVLRTALTITGEYGGKPPADWPTATTAVHLSAL